MNLKINDQSVFVPSCWDDCTFAQYEDYLALKENDAFGVIAIFTGIDRKIWENSKEVQNFYLIENSLAWLKRKPSKRRIKIMPYEITFDSKTIKVPQSQDDYIVKEYEDLRALIQLELKEAKEFPVTFYPKIVAVFLTRRIFPEYNSQNYTECVKLVRQLRLYQVLAMGNFFLKSLIELRSGTPKGWHILNTISKKLTQGLRAFRYGGFLTRLTNYRRVSLQKGRSF